MHGNIYKNIVTVKQSAVSRTKRRLYKYFLAMGLACVILQGRRSRVIDGWPHPSLSLDTEHRIKYGCLLVSHK